MSARRSLGPSIESQVGSPWAMEGMKEGDRAPGRPPAVSGKRGRRAPAPGSEELCCCEFVNRQGQTTHLLACCCDCEELDSACDSCFRCQGVGLASLHSLCDDITDRIRVPRWCPTAGRYSNATGTGTARANGGARRLLTPADAASIPPVLLLPAALRVAALHPAATLAAALAAPALLLAYFLATHRRRRRSPFFLRLGLASLLYLYAVFSWELWWRRGRTWFRDATEMAMTSGGGGGIGDGQWLCVTALFAAVLLLLHCSRRDPGYLDPSDAEEGAAGSPGSERRACEVCGARRPARAGHCRVCDRCVRRFDHHCVWIDSCVGEGNHVCFVALLALFVATVCVGLALALPIVCAGSPLVLALVYCPHAYERAEDALVYACAVYAALAAVFVSLLLCVQLWHVARNETQREAALAARGGHRHGGHRSHDRGVVRNCREFLMLGRERSRGKSAAEIV
ncbi:palmitoyltransferase ZDHHC23-B-like isoform X1 [Lampetra fluviatilis]